jgi:hypothetical protein
MRYFHHYPHLPFPFVVYCIFGNHCEICMISYFLLLATKHNNIKKLSSSSLSILSAVCLFRFTNSLPFYKFSPYY